MSSPTLERERRKLLWLRDKLRAQEEFVRELEQREADPLDALFEKELASDDDLLGTEAEAVRDGGDQHGATEPSQAVVQAPAATPQTLGPWASWTRTVKRLPSNWKMLLQFIGADGKNAEQVRAFAKQHDLMTWDTARAGLMNYRRDFGLLEPTKRGFYKLSQKGLAAITATEDESLAAENGNEASESLVTQPAVA